MKGSVQSAKRCWSFNKLGGEILVCRSLNTNQGPDKILPATDHRAWLPDQPVRIRFKETGPQSSVPISIPTMFKNTVEQFPNHSALGVKGPDGKNIIWTYSDYMEEVLSASKGFIALGLEPLHSVCILGHNSPEWAISNLAAVYARGFSTGIYQTNSADACRYVANHSRANIIVVDDNQQLEKILSIRRQLPYLKQIVQYNGTSGEEGVISWKDLIQLGSSESDIHLQTRLKDMAINNCALLVYTSGTTGNPKGAMISHDAVVNSARSPHLHFGWRFGQERLVSYLPLSHIAGQMLDIYWSITTGSTTYFADSNALKGTLVDNLKHFKPTRFLGVPRVWEKIEESIKTAGRNNKGIKKAVGDWAKAQSLSHHLGVDGGCTSTSLQYKLASKLVLSNVHKALGLDEVHNLEVATGGAATPAETHKYFLSLGIRLLDIYGSTESTGCAQSASRSGPGNSRIGTIGRILEGQLENKLINQDKDGAGELVSRGRSMFMGYYQDQQKTLETIDDEGWVRTGDICKQDSDGFYIIVGRSKEIIITSGGENIAPVNIEDNIKRSLQSLISNVMVIGDHRRYLSCLITLKVVVDPVTMQPTRMLTEQVLEILDQLNIPRVETTDQLLASSSLECLEKYIEEGISRANQNAISNAARVQKWRILEDDFSVQTGEFSPSLKLKRFFVHKKYTDLIDSMYSQ